MAETETVTKPKKKSRTIWKVIYIAATLLIIVGIAFIDPNFKDIFTVIPQMEFVWIAAALGLILLYWFSDGLILNHVTSYVHRRESIWHSFKVGVIGLYYGALTPFATGGQPVQVVYMKRDGIPVGTSTCIVCIKFFLYELALCSFFVIGMIFEGANLYQNFNEVFWFTLLGFVINLTGLIIMLLSLTHKTFIFRLVNGTIRLLAKIHLIKRPDEKIAKVETTLNDFILASKYMRQHKGKVVVSYFLTLLNFTLLFAIPYCIYVAFGHSQESFTTLLFMESFLYLAVAFFPLPGAAGASEGGFYLFFSSYFTKVPVFLPMVIWRFLTYYLVILVGCLVVVFDEIVNMRKNRKKKRAKQID